MSDHRDRAVAHAARVFNSTTGNSAIFDALVEAEEGRLEAVEVLRGVEWAGRSSHDPKTLRECPSCEQLEHYGTHAPGCGLSAVLAGAG